MEFGNVTGSLADSACIVQTTANHQKYKGARGLRMRRRRAPDAQSSAHLAYMRRISGVAGVVRVPKCRRTGGRLERGRIRRFRRTRPIRLPAAFRIADISQEFPRGERPTTMLLGPSLSTPHPVRHLHPRIPLHTPVHTLCIPALPTSAA